MKVCTYRYVGEQGKATSSHIVTLVDNSNFASFCVYVLQYLAYLVSQSLTLTQKEVCLHDRTTVYLCFLAVFLLFLYLTKHARTVAYRVVDYEIYMSDLGIFNYKSISTQSLGGLAQ